MTKKLHMILLPSEEEAERLLRYSKNNNVPGRLPNGAKVYKSVNNPDDLHPLGARATIVGCLGYRADYKDYGYYVEWDDMPGRSVFVIGSKIQLVN